MNKYSFNDLLSQSIIINEETGRSVQFNSIEIPMIQRDYAQGRDKEKDVRKRFLNAIFDSITGNEILEMDFVYGSVYESPGEKDSKEGDVRKFIPLDGQQRLTTLFLLYWYIGGRELNGEILSDTMANLNKFSYSTRASSRKFCADITNKYTDIIPKLANSSPRKAICNFSWFYNSYEKDPTVKAMLNMLEDIHARYSEIGRNDLFAGLDNLKFYVLPLDGFNLTEELYVKMNARGKPLTDFENFKADFIKWMKSDKNVDKERFHNNIKLHSREMPYYMAISQKLDNIWADIFWQEIKNLPEEELKPYGYVVDPYFMRFFHRYLCNLVIQNSGDAEIAENDETFRSFYGNNGVDQYIKFRSFEKYEKLLNFETVERIENVLDALSENLDIIRRHINPAWEAQKEWNLFDKSITQRQRIAFYATTLYLEHNKTFAEETYAEWMRVVWNLIVDSSIRNIPAMVRAMKQIKEFSAWSDDILSGLATINKCTVIENKMDEEASKARLILRDPQVWCSRIKKAESHKLFKGEIRFLLPNADNTSIDDFNAGLKAAEKIFEDNTLEDGDRDNYLWLRAVLAKNEEFPAEITLLNGRFDNWKTLINHQLITGIRDILYSVNAKPDTPVTDILKCICNDYQYDSKYPWVYPVVRWEGKSGEILLEYSESKKIQNYNYYGYWHEQTYLYNKNRWTDGNIILSTQRNKICATIIERLGFVMDWKYGNIQNEFFRGADVVLSKDLGDCRVILQFDTQYMRAGIKESDNKHLARLSTVVLPEFRAEGWIWRKKYDYQTVSSIEDIDAFVATIEADILNLGNAESLVWLINNSKMCPDMA